MAIDRDFIHEHQAMIAAAEVCWRPENPSQSWHGFDWMAWKLRRKYPLVMPHSFFVSMVDVAYLGPAS